MSQIMYQIGYYAGMLYRRLQQRPAPIVQETEELDQVPAMVRNGIDLNRWYDENVIPCAPIKPHKEPRRNTLAPLL
ncbi:hypothetical protein OH708_00785 [Pseudomonas capsici]|uniref:hypothetical protein n=1 Tax=Pseudomonas capsici TaxID=2810614 RepID=UPI0021F242F2|nr:hypothetical protein [Pseudomonas capsici]MCV4286430.1 hypothetical protein [Pseudomonas capsici]